MKIAIVTNYWKNSDGGGVRNYLIDLADALTNKGHVVSVLYREGNDPEQFYGGNNKLAFALFSYRRLKKEQPDLILSQGTWYCLLPGAFYKKLRGCRLVHTFHTEPSKGLGYYSKIFFQLLLDSCDCVTFVSKRLRERVIEIFDLSFPKTAITYAGVRAKEVSIEEVERFRAEYGINKGKIVLLANGLTAHPYKAEGLKLLIRAVHILRDKYPSIMLIATREGRYSKDLKTLVHDLGVDEHVILTGDVMNPFVPLKLCDIYTHITLSDGLPLALLEAMAMGKPIVSTPIGGIPEAVTDGVNGILVSPNIDEITERIDFILQAPEVSIELGAAAKRTVDEMFTWEQSAERFLQCYSNDSVVE